MKKQKLLFQLFYLFLLFLLLLFLEGMILFLYYSTHKESDQYLREKSFASTLSGSSDSRIPLSSKNPVFRQPFRNQYEHLNRFFLFFYHCDAANSGKIQVTLSDSDGRQYYEYSFEPQYMKQETFCLMADCNLELIPDATYELIISGQDFSPEDYIEIGTTSTASKPTVFPTMASDTLFTTLFYSYKDPSPLREQLKRTGFLLFGMDLLILLVILWFPLKTPRTAMGIMIVCALTGLLFLLAGYLKEQSKWYSKYDFISHAMGIIDSHDYSNCLEAFQAAYRKGHRVFEADFAMTSDNHIVLKHDWEKEAGLAEFENGYIPTLKEFKSARIWGKYTPMDIHDLLSLMLEYPDIYIVTDSKSGLYADAIQQFTQISQILNGYSERDRKHILSHLVVQIYNNDMYEGIQGILPIQNYIYTLYQRGIGNLEELTEFCKQKGIDVITIPHSWVTPELLSIFHDNHLKVYVHTLNETTDILKFKDLGVDGIYTDSCPAR